MLMFIVLYVHHTTHLLVLNRNAFYNIKRNEPESLAEASALEEPEADQQQRRRQQLINFAHSQWGFNNWSWAVTKQELDFVDFSNGKYSAGVAAFVSVSVRSLDISRTDVGYATTVAGGKGSAIFQARKCAVTNALRETLLSFGGNVARELIEHLDTLKTEGKPQQACEAQEYNQNTASKTIETQTIEPKSLPVNNVIRKDSSDSASSHDTPVAAVARSPHKIVLPQPPVKAMPPTVAAVPIAKAPPMPANHIPPLLNKPSFPANQTPPKPHGAPAPVAPLTHVRPNPNVSYVLQPMMSGVMPQLYASPGGPAPRMPPSHQHVFPNYCEYAPAPWHFAYDGYDRHHGNVNLNFNIPPKNLVVNSRSGTVECKNSCSPGKPSHGPEEQFHSHPPPPLHPHQQYHHHNTNPACWIKPTIFYDGFWTEQKVKKWVAEQVEKQFPEDTSPQSSSPGTIQVQAMNNV